jgi:alpha-L-fucosidase
MELNAFLHFGLNTFTDREWGYGDEDPNLFQPAHLDSDGIARVLAEAGFKGVILTCKHHDGFCLWPTKTTGHSIRKSSWRNGNGDVVREFADAAKRRGLAFGIYLSPWDRNNAAYGTPKYIEIYRAQLTELLTNYGPIFEVWHDGANGGDGYYGGAREKRTIDKQTYYDWPNTWELVRNLQPGAVIFSDVGPDIRWVGNEKGIAGDPCWATFDPLGEKGGPAAPGDVDTKTSQTGTPNGSHWMPAECDVSIRPGWFWHASENAKVKTPEELMQLYFNSVGRGAGLLLNVPPNRDGRFSDEDKEALRGFGKLHAATFASKKPWDGAGAISGNRVTLRFPDRVKISVIRLRENIREGQRIQRVSIEGATNNADWHPIAQITSVGNCRLIRLEQPVSVTRISLQVEGPGEGLLSEIGFY